MDGKEFIEKFCRASGELDMKRIGAIITGCVNRCDDKYPQYEHGHMNIVSTMEECAELIEAISRRMRGRTDDNFEVMEEIGDVILSILCVAEIFGISHMDIRKAINVKMDREAGRIEQHLKGIETQ